MATDLINIVLLDMDGVLCNPRACLAMRNIGVSSYLDPVACMLVKRLCIENNAKLVITSHSADMFDKAVFTAMLNSACPEFGSYIVQDATMWKTRTWVEGGQAEHI